MASDHFRYDNRADDFYIPLIFDLWSLDFDPLRRFVRNGVLWMDSNLILSTVDAVRNPAVWMKLHLILLVAEPYLESETAILGCFQGM